MAKSILYLTPTTVGVKFINTSGSLATDTLSLTNDLMLYNERVRGFVTTKSTGVTVSSGSPTVAVSDTSLLAVGQYIYGVGIASGSVITSVTTNTSVTISQNAIGAGTSFSVAAPYLGTQIITTASTTQKVATYSAAVVGTFTGSIAGNILTVTSVPSASLTLGSYLSGTNVTLNSVVVNQLSGTAGGIGTYQLSKASTAGSTTISFGNLNTAIQVGHILTGLGQIAQNTVIVGHSWSAGVATLNLNLFPTSATTATANYNPIYPFPQVDIISAVSTCSGSGTNGMTISRGIAPNPLTSVIVSPASNTAQFELDFSQTQIKENQFNSNDLTVATPTSATLYVTLRKTSGYETALQYEQFGAYDDPTSFVG